MARKRMFDLEVINQESFFDMPMETKALYFLLGMEADDEGFVSPKKVLRLYGGTEDSLKVLVTKEYIIPFKTGVIVITDWKRNNYLDKNRIKETIYQEEKNQLTYNEKTEKYELIDGCLTNVKQMLNEYSIDKNSIDKNINNICSSEFEKEFDTLWKLYPKKVGKKDALRHYIRNRKKKVSYETILEGLQKYKDYIEKSNTPLRFVKDGSSWFNQESWNDDRKIDDEQNIPKWFNQDLNKESELTDEEREFIKKVRGDN